MEIFNHGYLHNVDFISLHSHSKSLVPLLSVLSMDENVLKTDPFLLALSLSTISQVKSENRTFESKQSESCRMSKIVASNTNLDHYHGQDYHRHHHHHHHLLG